jgi:cytochrome b involved in lipid metabolism
MSSAANAAPAPPPATVYGGGGGGGGGSGRGVSRAELARHNTRASAWLAIRGDVYDLTHFAARHPGGSAVIFSNAGRDASSVFTSAHAPYLHPQERIGDLLVGRLLDG